MDKPGRKVFAETARARHGHGKPPTDADLSEAVTLLVQRLVNNVVHEFITTGRTNTPAVRITIDGGELLSETEFPDPPHKTFHFIGTDGNPASLPHIGGR
jgi:hypothetical protein